MASEKDKGLASSRQLVPVAALLPEHRSHPDAGSVIVMRNGSFRSIVRSGAVNFDMKNRTEQSGLTFAFGALVNSLDVDFPLQIISHSKMLDIDAYVRQFEAPLSNDRTPAAIRSLIAEHVQHFETHVKTNKLLQRELYVVVPWANKGGPVEKSLFEEVPLAPIFRAVSRKMEDSFLGDSKPSDSDVAVARQQLAQRVGIVRARLSQMSLASQALNEDEVRKLLYSLFHPALAEVQKDPGGDTDGVIQVFSRDALYAADDSKPQF